MAKAVLLLGPTASGKTALGVKLAHAFNAEVISIDSALVYRGMDIADLLRVGRFPKELADAMFG